MANIDAERRRPLHYQVNEMERFLYLSEADMIDAWVNGGPVPLFPASTYRSLERDGTRTPDEQKTLYSTGDPAKALQLLGLDFHGELPSNWHFLSRFNSGLPDASIVTGQEDGLVLCLSTKFDIERQANRLRKNACVKLNDIHKLKQALDGQIGSVSAMHECSYTRDPNRGPFLKSIADSWQKEYRLYWRGKAKRTVMIPTGTAVEVWRRTNEPKDVLIEKECIELRAQLDQRTTFADCSVVVTKGFEGYTFRNCKFALHEEAALIAEMGRSRGWKRPPTWPTDDLWPSAERKLTIRDEVAGVLEVARSLGWEIPRTWRFSEHLKPRSGVFPGREKAAFERSADIVLWLASGLGWKPPAGWRPPVTSTRIEGSR